MDPNSRTVSDRSGIADEAKHETRLRGLFRIYFTI